MTETRDEPPRERLLTWTSGGIVIALTVLLVLAVAVHRGFIIYESLVWSEGKRVPHSMASYGFDLAGARVPITSIIPSGNHRDFFRSLDFPVPIGADEAEQRSRPRRKLIANAERVVGVTVGGESRAYPIRILAYHEVINDTLGGVPIAVTYSPVCFGVVVFHRRVADETLQFAYSGLLHNTNLLMYDRREDGAAESLWCQLQGRALVGPAAHAGKVLRMLPCQLLTWKDWRTAHPDTTTIHGKPSYVKKKIYGQDRYGRYYFEGELKPQYPVDPLPPAGERPYMSHVMALHTGGKWHEVFHADVARNADSRGIWKTRIAGHDVTFHHGERPETLWFEWANDPPADLKVIHTLWFAWFALREGG